MQKHLRDSFDFESRVMARDWVVDGELKAKWKTISPLNVD